MTKKLSRLMHYPGKRAWDLWDLPRAELPSHVQLSPDSKILLWNGAHDDMNKDTSYSVGTDSPEENNTERTAETNQGLNIQAPVFKPTESRLTPPLSSHSVRRRLWEDNEKEDTNSGCSELDDQPQKSSTNNGHLRRSISDSDIGSKYTEPEPKESSSRDKASNENIGPACTDAWLQKGDQAAFHAQMNQNPQLKPGMRSQTPDFHGHKHAVVSVKEIEQQLQLQQRYTAYPIDVVCSPFHVSQHAQRQCAMQQTQPVQHNMQHLQMPFDLSSKQPQFQQSGMQNVQQMHILHANGHPPMDPNSPASFPHGRHVMDISMQPRVQLTYAQVATQQGNIQREVQRVQTQQLHQQAPQSHKQYPAERPQQYCQQSQDVLQRQYHEQQFRHPQHEFYNQSLLMEQHKGSDRSFQQTQAFHQEQLQRQTQQQQMWSQQSGQQPVNSRVSQNDQTINDQNMHIPHPTVRQLFLNARAQQQMQAMSTANQQYQQPAVHNQLHQTQQQKAQPNVFFQQLTPRQPCNHLHQEQHMPWNNNNNSDTYSQQDPGYNPVQLPRDPVTNMNRDAQQAIPSLMSLDVGFRPEAARVFQLSQQPNQNLAINHHIQQISIHTEQQLRQNWFLQQQTGQYQQVHGSSSASFEQFVPPAETRRQLDTQQYFRDVAAVSYNTNALNHGNMR